MSEVETSSNTLTIAKLAAAFAKAQGKFRTPTLNRSAKITKDGRLLYETHYADLQECIDCVRGPLESNGLSFMQTTQMRGTAWYLVLELMHESGASKETSLPLNVNQTNQQLGGTMTYLKRYQLSAFFGLAADFDDDGNATEGNEVKFAAKQPIKNHAPKHDNDLDAALENQRHPDYESPQPPSMREQLAIMVEERGMTNEDVKSAMKLATGTTKNSREMSDEELETVIKFIKLKK